MSGIAVGSASVFSIASDPCATHVSGFEENHPDSERAHLIAQRFGVTFQGKFAGTIESLKGKAKQASQRANVYNQAGPSLAHGRQHRAADAQHAEKIRLKLLTRILHRAVLKRTSNRVTGAVYD